MAFFYYRLRSRSLGLSVAWFVLFTPREKPRQQAARDFR